MKETGASRRAFLAGAGALLAGAAGSGPALAQRSAPPRARVESAGRDVRIDIRRIDRFDLTDEALRRFNRLHFLSGLEMHCDDSQFGGFSAFRMTGPDGQFLALTDRAEWLKGRILTDAAGRMTGLEGTRMAAMTDQTGRLIRNTRWYDTESLALSPQGIFVGVERTNAILRFEPGPHGFPVRGRSIPIPAAVRKLPSNRGLEGLDVMPARSRFAGALLGLAERGRGGNAYQGFLIGGPQPGEFRIVRHNNYDISDCAFTPSGDLIVLERFFTWRKGLRIRIRLIPLDAIRPGARIDAALIFEATMRHEIDNFEGVSAHQNSAGQTILTLISDDNFSWFQRNLLMQFRLD